MNRGECLIYIEYYRKQINNNHSRNAFYESDEFKEYCALNCYLNSFHRSNNRLKELIIGDIKELTQEDHDLINKAVSELKETVLKLPTDFLDLIRQSSVKGIIFMLGDSTVDSHGIIINNKSYIVIDMSSYIRGYDNYNPISFLVHELLHAIHYSLTPEMYFRNHKSESESVLKRMITEGIATYLTSHYTEETDEDVYWLGYLDHEGINQWKSRCDQMREEASIRIKNLLDKGIWKEDYQYEFYSVIDPDNLWRGRLAYFYGSEIARLYCKDNGAEKLLHEKYDGLLPYLKAYFR